MKEYKNIKNEVITDSESRKNNTAFYILNGYMKTWGGRTSRRPRQRFTGVQHRYTLGAVQERHNHPGKGCGACHGSSFPRD